MKKVLTFEGLLKQYILEKPLSEASITTYRGVVKRFIKDTGIRNLTDITFEPLLEWRLDVRQRSSDITWNNYLRHMRALSKFAIKKHYVPGVDHFKNLNWGKYNSNKTKTITDKQLKKIMLFLSNSGCSLEPCWFWKTVVYFMYYSGVRRKQLVMLTWKDINFTDKTIYLNAKGEKTDIERSIPMVEILEQNIIRYRELLLKENPLGCSPESQLFNITKINSHFVGETMTEEQLSGFFRRLGNKVDIPISAHRLRHTMATKIAQTGQIKPLQQILGHTNIGTTMNFYVHPDIEQLRDAANTLGDI